MSFWDTPLFKAKHYSAVELNISPSLSFGLQALKVEALLLTIPWYSTGIYKV